MPIIPKAHRTTASPRSTTDYVHYGGQSGLSWAVPWLAGLYALCLEVDTNLTGEDFLNLVMETGTPINIHFEAENNIVTNPSSILPNPVRLIQSLQVVITHEA